LLQQDISTRQQAQHILRQLKNLTESQKRQRATLRQQKRDLALQYQDLRQKLKWGPAFQEKSNTSKAQKTVEKNKEKSLKIETKSSTSSQSTALFASRMLGFLVQTKEKS
jgi:hypothetical protein